jgi:hypothetical protein
VSEQAARPGNTRIASIRMQISLNFISGISSINSRFTNCSTRLTDPRRSGEWGIA